MAACLHDLTDGFEQPGYDDGHWVGLPAPSRWQLHGYGCPIFSAASFASFSDAGCVADDSPTGEYRYEFELGADWSMGSAVLQFESLESCLQLWLNGRPLGYSTADRLTEFSVGSQLRRGRNVLAVRVYQWSAASYVEDQDMWWLSGIFRSARLFARP